VLYMGRRRDYDDDIARATGTVEMRSSISSIISIGLELIYQFAYFHIESNR